MDRLKATITELAIGRDYAKAQAESGECFQFGSDNLAHGAGLHQFHDLANGQEISFEREVVTGPHTRPLRVWAPAVVDVAPVTDTMVASDDHLERLVANENADNEYV